MITSDTPSGSSAFRLLLLGQFRLEQNGAPVRFSTRKIESLLAFMALNPGPHARSELAALGWGDVSETRARNSLRNALANMRSVLGDELFHTERDSVTLVASPAFWVDAQEFGARANRYLLGESPELSDEMLALYAGELLPGLYEDWIAPERERLRSLFLFCLDRAMQQARSHSAYERAIALAQRILAVDRAAEHAHQALIFCYLALGDRASALKQYAECVRILRDELGVDPSAETVALWNRANAAGRASRLAAAAVTNLPMPITSFVGRAREITVAKELLSGARLLTLTGPGGVGKTRLCIQVASEVLDQFPDGVWWVDLASLQDPALVPQTVARSLGIREDPQRPLTVSLGDFLRSRRLLLVLDNCEQVLSACAQLAGKLLTAAGGLRVLATGREGLGITGEVAWPVPVLTTPNGGAPDPQHLLQYESIRLFVERAHSVRPAFVLDAQSARAVRDVCKRLDGIPLAIELAAAQMRQMPVGQIAERIDRRLALAGDSVRGTTGRHQTLRAAIDWSYDLLSVVERSVFACLSVFVGGFTPEAAQRVVKEATDGLTATEVLFYLSRLAEKSLLSVEVNAEGERYRFLETIREYALERLAQDQRGLRAHQAHGAYYLGLAEDAAPELAGPQQAEWLARLECEHDNLRSALQWCLDCGRSTEAMRLAAALTRFWRTRGYLSEARGWFARVLDSDDAAPPVSPRDPRYSDHAALRSRVLNSAGTMSWEQADYRRARVLYEQSLNLRLNLEDQWGIAQSLGNLGYVAFSEGDLAAARERMQECLVLYRELGDQHAIGDWLTNLGNVADRQADYPAAQTYYHQALAVQRSVGDKRGIANLLNNLGNVAIHQFEYGPARALYEETLAIRQELGDKTGIGAALSNLSDLCWIEGDRPQALDLCTQSLMLRREIGDREGIAISLCQVVYFAIARGDLVTARANLIEELTLSREIENLLQIAYGLERAARLAASLAAAWPDWLERGVCYLSAANAIRARHRLLLPVNERPEREQLDLEFRRRLDPARYAAAARSGSEIPLDQIVTSAIAHFGAS